MSRANAWIYGCVVGTIVACITVPALGRPVVALVCAVIAFAGDSRG